MSRRTKSPNKRSLIVNVAIIGVTFYIGFMAGTVTSPLGPGAEPSYITVEGSKATSLLQKQVNSLETDLWIGLIVSWKARARARVRVATQCTGERASEQSNRTTVGLVVIYWWRRGSEF